MIHVAGLFARSAFLLTPLLVQQVRRKAHYFQSAKVILPEKEG